MMKKKITVSTSLIPAILGKSDEHLKKIKQHLNIDISVLNDVFVLTGEDENVENGIYLIENLVATAQKRNLTPDDVRSALKMIAENSKTEISEVLIDRIKVAGRAKSISPKTEKQKAYIEAMRDNDIVFGIGPAGTGKTYLAMAMAVNYYLNKRVSRIILTRPAVEAGEKLGFLPGDIADKINPYLRPLYDALYDMIGADKALRLIEKGIIELAPIAFMRGRTLNDAFIILDEAQNSTTEQMKMFLTRIGFNSKAVITGDVTQIDLPSDRQSGLVRVQQVLKNIEGINFARFTEVDVVRHSLVQDIIKAYEKFEEKGR